MNDSASKRNWLGGLRSRILVTGLLVAVVWFVDHNTGPSLDLSIAYFLPITFGAWAVGRWAGVITAVVADIPTYHDQLQLVQAGHLTAAAAASIVVARLLIFLFTAEVAYRLVESRRRIEQDARRLAQINDELELAYGRLEDDLTAAGTLQADVLEFVPPAVPGCDIGAAVRYAGPTGGDLADAGGVNGSAYVCVADISGKGTPAALFTALLKHVLQEAHQQGLRGPEVVAALDSACRQRMPPERFATVFYAEIDPEKGAIDYVSAGHPEALILRAASGELEAAGSTTALIGQAVDDPDFAPRRIGLNPGDTVVIYTDGAVESKTPTGEFLGDGPIKRLAAEYVRFGAKEMADRIVEGLLLLIGSASRDDIAVVCARVTRFASRPSEPSA